MTYQSRKSDHIKKRSFFTSLTGFLSFDDLSVSVSAKFTRRSGLNEWQEASLATDRHGLPHGPLARNLNFATTFETNCIIQNEQLNFKSLKKWIFHAFAGLTGAKCAFSKVNFDFDSKIGDKDLCYLLISNYALIQGRKTESKQDCTSEVIHREGDHKNTVMIDLLG